MFDLSVYSVITRMRRDMGLQMHSSSALGWSRSSQKVCAASTLVSTKSKTWLITEKTFTPSWLPLSQSSQTTTKAGQKSQSSSLWERSQWSQTTRLDSSYLSRSCCTIELSSSWRTCTARKTPQRLPSLTKPNVSVSFASLWSRTQ